MESIAIMTQGFKTTLEIDVTADRIGAIHINGPLALPVKLLNQFINTLMILLSARRARFIFKNPNRYCSMFSVIRYLLFFIS